MFHSHGLEAPKKITSLNSSFTTRSPQLDGRALLVNFPRRVVLHHFNFKQPVRDLSFSPDGRWIAVILGKLIQIWRAPGFTREFAPFVLFTTLGGHYDTILSISWSLDSKNVITTSKDMTVRIWSIDTKESGISNEAHDEDKAKHVRHVILAGHRHSVLKAWLVNEATLYSVSKDGSVFMWKKGIADDTSKTTSSANEHQQSNDQPPAKRSKPERPLHAQPQSIKTNHWRISERHYFQQGGRVHVVSVAYDQKLGLVVAGFSNGIFGLWEMPDFTNIHSLRYGGCRWQSLFYPSCRTLTVNEYPCMK